jgi:hypothetical protein
VDRDRLKRTALVVTVVVTVLAGVYLLGLLARAPWALNPEATQSQRDLSQPPASPVPLASQLVGESPMTEAPSADALATEMGGLPLASSPSPTLTAFRTLIEESFADNRRDWPSNPQSTAWFTDGGYRLFARRPGEFVAVGPPIAEALRDVVVTARFRKVGGPAGGGYGLIVRDQGPGPRDGINQTGRFYVLEVSDFGEMGIWRRDMDRWVDVLPWTRSEHVRTGDAANEITVHAIGQRLTLVLNGTQLTSQEDSVLSEGAVGLFMGGDLNEVVVDRFTVELPNMRGMRLPGLRDRLAPTEPRR